MTRESDSMFTNRSGCTVYEKTVQNRAPTYVRHVLGALYWQPSEGQTGGKDRTEQDDIFVSVPEASVTYLPKEGDRIVGDIVLEEQPPQSAHTVMNVKDLRYGSPRVRHIELRVR